MAPDVVLANSPLVLRALREQTSTIPIVFALVVDPVGEGFVKSLAQPGGNITGFTSFEYELSGKWLEVLKEIAPDVRAVLVINQSENVTAAGYVHALESAGLAAGERRAGRRFYRLARPALLAAGERLSHTQVVRGSLRTTLPR